MTRDCFLDKPACEDKRCLRPRPHMTHSHNPEQPRTSPVAEMRWGEGMEVSAMAA